MTEYWERSRVSGTGENGRKATEEILHRRGADPVVMACRRSNYMAGCSKFTVETGEAFIQIRAEEQSAKKRREIPKDLRNQEAWDW